MSTFNTLLSFAILIIAGAFLVVQNLLMVRITASASTVLITLVLNSSVGLVMLVSALLFRNGLAGLTEIVTEFKPWHLLPGLFGAFFVFASIYGYQRWGASITIATLVTSQLLAGLIADHLLPGSDRQPIGLSSIVGAILLILGVVFLVQGRR